MSRSARIGEKGIAIIRDGLTPDDLVHLSSWPRDRAYKYCVVEAPNGEPWVIYIGPPGEGILSANTGWFDYRFSPVVGLDALLELVRKMPEPSEREREQQAMCFAYGQIACGGGRGEIKGIPSRDVFKKLAISHYNWKPEEFDAWASTREWSL